MAATRTRRRLVLQLVALLGAAVMSSATPAAAGLTQQPGSGPVITSHTNGQQVGGEIVVTVESAAPEVAIALDSGTGAVFDGTTVTRDGAATATISTSGHHGPTMLVARECTNTGDCDGGAQTSVEVHVENPRPTFAPGRWQEYLYGDRHLMEVVDEGPWAFYGFFFDGKYLPPVTDQSFFPLWTSQLGDGQHTVQVAHCSRSSYDLFLEPPICDMENATEPRAFTLVSAMVPTITDVRPRTITPDGDGVDESATVDVTVQAPHNLYWGLVRESTTVATGTEVRTEAGEYSFTVDGLDDAGWPLPADTYELVLVAYVPGTDVQGRTSTTLTVEYGDPVVHPPTEPTPAPLSPVVTSVMPRTISPNGDGVSDYSTVIVTVDAPHTMRWQLLAGAETVARGEEIRDAAGLYAFTVDGLGADGQPVRSGTYELRLSVIDAEGRRMGETSTTLRVDTDPASVVDASATPSTFFPRRDGYRDQVRIAGTLSEDTAHFRVRVLRDGQVVRRLWLGRTRAGRFTTTWDGRTRRGRLLAAGPYRYQFEACDRAGNWSRSQGGLIRLRRGR